MTFNESKSSSFDIKDIEVDGFKVFVGNDVDSSNYLIRVKGDDDDVVVKLVDKRQHVALIRIREKLPTKETLKKVAWELIKLYKEELPVNVVHSKVKFVGDEQNSYDIHVDLKVNEGNVGTQRIEFTDSGYDPSDIRYTFLAMVQKTYPHGYEEQVAQMLPDVEVDEFGNYYKVIGNSKTMFVSHLDTRSDDQTEINLFSKSEGDSELIMTDGETILGADDKAGVALMVYMMYNEVPGIYYFFIGEEAGCIGSKAVSDSFDTQTHLHGVERCVAFDRKGNHSIITKQKDVVCCSDEFSDELCSQMNSNGLDMKKDPTGVSSDSASFMGVIPECTNISVGYMNEHTPDECLDMTYLKKLSDVCVNIDWESLPLSRKLTQNETTDNIERMGIEGK